jgi:hypothetical protein
MDTIDDVGAQLWSVAEDTQDNAEMLIYGLENDGWVEEHAKNVVRCPTPSLSGSQQ